MDYVNLSASMTMLELVRFLLQDSNNSFSFYSGKILNLNHIKENAECNSKITTICQYICKKVREAWIVHNIGIIAVNDGELMICVTSPDPSVPTETTNFIVEAIEACSVDLKPEKSRMTVDGEDNGEDLYQNISPDLIQVNVAMKEVNERIEQFLSYKRDQANTNNVLDFCGASADRVFCARVDAVLVRKKDSSSHMAVRNVLDRYTAKHNTKKEDESVNLPNVSITNHATQESSDYSQMMSSSTNPAETSSQKGEKRTFDIASLESMLSNVKKQQRT